MKKRYLGFLFLFFSTIIMNVNAVTKVTLDSDGVARINGKRTFIYGTYRDASDNRRVFDSVKEAGFNLTHCYHFESITPIAKEYSSEVIDQYIKDAIEYLDLAEKAGVGVFIGFPREVVRNADLVAIKRIVLALKDKNALWFWYLMDEPSGRDHRKISLVDAMKRCYLKTKKLDANHPVALVDARGYRKYFKYCDIIWADGYPLPKESFMPIAFRLHEARKEQPDKPSWYVLQGHDLSVYEAVKKNKKSKVKKVFTDKNHRPNSKEIRAQVHFAIAEGSRGGILFYWLPKRWHDLKKNTPKVWEAICEAGRELRALEPVLLSSQKVPKLKIGVEYSNFTDPHGWVNSWSRMYQGKLYLGVVNASYNSKVKVSITLPVKYKNVYRLQGAKTVLETVNGNYNIKSSKENQKVPIDILDNGKNKILFSMDSCDVAVWCFEL
jgi:hypothetical protein